MGSCPIKGTTYLLQESSLLEKHHCMIETVTEVDPQPPSGAWVVLDEVSQAMACHWR